MFPGRFLFLPTFILPFHLFLTYYVYENSLIIFFLMSGREEEGERNRAKLYRVVQRTHERGVENAQIMAVLVKKRRHG